MKTTILYILLVIATTLPAFAQKDAQAKAILNPISQKYRSYNAIQSDFTFSLDNAQQNIKASQTGTLTVEPKTNKYKITLYSPNSAKPEIDQEIISDGKSQWSYNKADKEVQLSNADHSNTSFNPAQLFTMYEHGYKYIYNGEIKQSGKIYQVVDLTPEDDKITFFKIRLTIDKVKKVIYSALIFDKNGNKYNYVLKTLTPNPTVNTETFSFNSKEHPSVEVVDLR